MNKIFFFDSMITPKIIIFLYWLSLIAILFSGLAAIFVAHHFIAGILTIIFGAIGSRVTFEMIIVVFKNNEYLRRIAEKP